MNEPETRMWLTKAGNDLKIGKDEMQTDAPVTDMVCFHMQQCVEKALKAYLVRHNVEVPRTHNLAVILQLCVNINSVFSSLIDAGIDRLTDYAVEIRYPDDYVMPTGAEARQAVETAAYVLQFVEDLL